MLAVASPKHMAIVVTSIAAPNRVMAKLASGAADRDMQFIVVGDVPSPPDFSLDGCRFYSLKAQQELGYAYARQCPTRHYARKNIGYLLALENADIIVETDDDNLPTPEFWAERSRRQPVPTLRGAGVVNAYRYFTDAHIWPRGLPLRSVLSLPPSFDELPLQEADCPIQQGLADANPDVDAIYRLTQPLPQSFRQDRRVALASGTWCPFNSQNTTWWREAAPLLYLPAYCSFRMTDIWRSFVAQRVAWEYGWSVLFHEPTVWQDRNEHDLMRDFRDELPGYQHNDAILDALGQLSLRKEIAAMGENLRICYEQMVRMGFVEQRELQLVDAWLSDLDALPSRDDRTPL